MTIRSFAKVNIYLKIIGIKNDYHLINSRFMLVKNLFDTISFVKKQTKDEKFEISGNFSCKIEENIIYKAYLELLGLKEYSQKIQNFFKYYKVEVKKNIPEFAGLGGGSSNAAFFLHLTNGVLSLDLSQKTLLGLSYRLGADVSFFISSCKSATVEGIGDKVKTFDEDLLDLETFTPDIKCKTPMIYKEYRKKLNKNYDKIIKNNKLLSSKIKSLKSDEIMDNFKIEELNDLYEPAVLLYPGLKDYKQDGYFFSGSGSSFFRRKDG